MLISESIYVSLFLFAIVFCVLFSLYLFIKVFSSFMGKFQRVKK